MSPLIQGWLGVEPTVPIRPVRPTHYLYIMSNTKEVYTDNKSSIKETLKTSHISNPRSKRKHKYLPKYKACNPIN